MRTLHPNISSMSPSLPLPFSLRSLRKNNIRVCSSSSSTRLLFFVPHSSPRTADRRSCVPSLPTRICRPGIPPPSLVRSALKNSGTAVGRGSNELNSSSYFCRRRSRDADGEHRPATCRPRSGSSRRSALCSGRGGPARLHAPHPARHHPPALGAPRQPLRRWPLHALLLCRRRLRQAPARHRRGGAGGCASRGRGGAGAGDGARCSRSGVAGGAARRCGVSGGSWRAGGGRSGSGRAGGGSGGARSRVVICLRVDPIPVNFVLVNQVENYPFHPRDSITWLPEVVWIVRVIWILRELVQIGVDCNCIRVTASFEICVN